MGSEQVVQVLERQPRNIRDVHSGEGDRQSLRLEPLALADRAVRARQKLRHPALHHRALRRGEGLQDVFASAREGALIAGLFLALQRPPRLGRRVSGVDRHGRLFVGEQDPVAVLLRELAPRPVHVVAERHEDVSQVLALPGCRPRGDRALSDGQTVVGHQGAFADLVHATDAVAIRAGAFRRVRRERLRVQERLLPRIVAGARVKHPQQVRQRRDASDRGSGGRRSALLLQRHRRRQPLDRIDLRHRHLVEEPPRIRRDGFQIAPLGFRVERPEGQRRLSGSGDAGEDDERVAGDFERDVLEIVLACSANPHESTVGFCIPFAFSANQRLIHSTFLAARGRSLRFDKESLREMTGSAASARHVVLQVDCPYTDVARLRFRVMEPARLPVVLFGTKHWNSR